MNKQGGGKLSYEYISSLCMELYLSMNAGISVSEGLLLVSEGEKDPFADKLIKDLYEDIEMGYGLADSFEKTEAFPAYMINMLRIGEQTGKHDEIFKALSEYYIRQKNITDTIKKAVFFPSVLFTIMLVIIGVLLIKILPIFNDVFTQIGSNMSPLAMFFLNVGIALGKGKYIILAIIVLLIACALCVYFIPSLKERFTKFKNDFTGKTQLGCIIGRARFTSALALSIASGVDTDTALAMAENLCEGTEIGRRAGDCRRFLDEGETLINAITRASLLEPLYCRMLSVGVKTGSADVVISEIAKRSEEAANESIDRTIGKIEPIFVVVMSVMIGLVLLSVMLPMMGIMSSI